MLTLSNNLEYTIFMTEITLEAIAKTVGKVIKQELEPIDRKLNTIEKTLESHTLALDQLVLDKKTREEEKIVSIHRFERLEKWARRVGEQLGIKLEF